LTFTVADLGASTWDAFAELVERNHGIFGGCWCIGWHLTSRDQHSDYRSAKAERVRAGNAHAALVFDEDGLAQGWCQYGSPQELRSIKNRRSHDEGMPPPPDWRIACIFVDKRHRGQGIARIALGGALERIAQHDGELVEAILEVTADRTAWIVSRRVAAP
jgi:ribosomal protein S18 acetylase RimI-like enzyme